MPSDEMPDAAFTRTVRGYFGEELTIAAYAPEDDDGAVQFVIRDEQGGAALSAHISSPAEREALARAWMEACRIADGEPAMARGARSYDPAIDNCAGMPGDGNVRIQITSKDAGMSVDLDRNRAVNFAVGILRQAGVSSVSINPDGSYRAGTGEAAATVAAEGQEERK